MYQIIKSARHKAFNLVVLLALLAGQFTIFSSQTSAYSSGTWATTSGTNKITSPQAVLLDSGNVFITGGYAEDATKLTQIYSVATNTISDGPTLSGGRQGAAVGKLPGNKVLVAGGRTNDQLTNTAYIFDEATMAFTQTASMLTPRTRAITAVLSDSRVMVIGGVTGFDEFGRPIYTDSVEVFDPRINLWLPGAPYPAKRAVGYLINLTDGRIMTYGGSGNSGDNTSRVFVFSPLTNIWLETGSIPSLDSGSGCLAALPQGKALVGGPSSTYIWDPLLGTWNVGARYAFYSDSCAYSMADGDIFVLGSNSSNSSYVYEVATDTWTFAGTPPDVGSVASVNLLNGNLFLVSEPDDPLTPSSFVFVKN